jgi:hypothetical protein
MTQTPGGWGQPPAQQQQQQGWGQPPAQQQYPAQQPQQGWGQPPAQQQAPWGGQPQQNPAPHGPPPVPAQSGDEFDDFFSGGVKGEPGFDWGATQNAGKARQGANIAGIITEMVQMQQTDFATREPKFYQDGAPMMQVAITLQTQLRGWEGIKPDQIPVDPNTGQPKHPSQDVGLRRIYVKNDMKRAVTEACNKVGQKPRKGGQLAVLLKGFEDRGKGNPLPLYDAVYQPAPDDGGTAGFFQASGPGQQVSAGQDAAPQQTYAQGSSFGGGDRGLQQQPPAPPAQQGPPPGWQPPQGQGYAVNAAGQPEQVGPPPGQNPSSLGNSPAPTTPPDFAQPGYGQAPAEQAPPQQQAPQYDGPNF